MSHPSSLKKETETESVSKVAPRFDRNRLAHELLSLGNPKITSTLARLIAQEVEDDLQSAPLPALSAELISDMVRKKLEELGLIEIKSIKPRQRKSDTEKAMKTIHPFTPRTAAQKSPAKPPRPALEALRWSEEGAHFFSSLSLPLENEPQGAGKDSLHGVCAAGRALPTRSPAPDRRCEPLRFLATPAGPAGVVCLEGASSGPLLKGAREQESPAASISL